jgi:hypothetical protein
MAGTLTAAQQAGFARELAGLLEIYCDDPDIIGEALRLVGRADPVGVIAALKLAAIAVSDGSAYELL